MFGLFKTKPLDEVKLVQNVAAAVLDVWLDKATLKSEKFMKVRFFVVQSGESEEFGKKIMLEKLRIAAAFAGVSIIKTAKREDLVSVYLKHLKEELGELNLGQGFMRSFDAEVGDYMTTFMVDSPGEAGKYTEKRFSEAVFGVAPSANDVDANYVLYKELSGFQRTVIIAISAALRRSY